METLQCKLLHHEIEWSIMSAVGLFLERDKTHDINDKEAVPIVKDSPFVFQCADRFLLDAQAFHGCVAVAESKYIHSS